MDELKTQLNELLEKIHKLHPTKDKAERERLLYQLRQKINSLTILEEKLTLIAEFSQKLNITDIKEKLLRQRLITDLIRLLQDSGKELNEQLQVLAQLATRYQPLRLQLIQWIILLLQQNNKLWKSLDLEQEDHYADTILYLGEFLDRNLEKYDPTKGSFATWINIRLKGQFFDNRNKTYHQTQKRATIQTTDSGEIVDPLDTIEAEQDGFFFIQIPEQIKQWAETDPELPTIHIKNRPDINASVVILNFLEKQLSPEDITWQQLSDKFGIPFGTLTAFYNRHCKPKLLKFVEDLGYYRPDTPVNPSEHFKFILDTLKKRDKKIKDAIEQWVKEETKLSRICCKQNSKLTAKIIFERLLAKKLVLKKLADEFEIKETDIEKFYEFHCQRQLHKFLRNQGYNITEIYENQSN